jgi:hypothetical protein
MFIISSIEFNYLMANGRMYKYLRYFNKFSRSDEPLMIIDSLGKKRVGTCKTTLNCILQGKINTDTLEKFVKETPYKDSNEWLDEINKLYIKSTVNNGYIFLLELNKVEISIVNNHPSCKGCIKVNGCGLYRDLIDPIFCENRVSNIDIDSPLVVIQTYRTNLYNVFKDLDKLKDIEERNNMVIEISGIMQDIRGYLHV